MHWLIEIMYEEDRDCLKIDRQTDRRPLGKMVQVTVSEDFELQYSLNQKTNKLTDRMMDIQIDRLSNLNLTRELKAGGDT